MAKYAVGEKVLIPGTVTSVLSNESGDYYEIKVKANNKMTTLNCEEEDITTESESAITDETTP